MLGVVNQVFSSKGDRNYFDWNRIWEDHIASPNTKDKAEMLLGGHQRMRPNISRQ